MPRELDAAMAAAHELTREPVVHAKPAQPNVPVKAGAPAVKVDKSKHRVRLRNIDHALEGCVSTRGGEERFRLEPNKWTLVSDAVYTMLRDKFYKPQEFDVTNWEMSGSHAENKPRVEQYQEYILEFPDEMD